MDPLAGYAACKSAVVVHTDDGSQTNYQMKLTIVKGDGVDSAGTTYLDNKALNWPYDIRFTKADGTLLDFYRRESDATDGTWWIEIDSIPDPDNAIIYLHVGDADAVDASNLANTFGAEMADDFEWGADGDSIEDNGGNITSWVEVHDAVSYGRISTEQAFSGTRSLKGNVHAAVLAGGGNFTKAAGTNYAINYMLYKPINGYLSFYHGNASKNMNVNAGVDESLTYFDGSAHNIGTVTAGVWQEYEYSDINHATPKYDVYLDGVKKGENLNMQTTGAVANLVCLQTNGDITYVDSLLIRKWTANEPTWGAWGDWETGGGITVVRNKLISIGREPIKRIKFHKTLKLR